MARKILKVNEPEDIEPVDVTLKPIENAERLELGGSVFEEVGKCHQCGVKVYRLVSGDPAVIGNQLVVYVAYSNKEPPGTFCQLHDPNMDHRLKFTPTLPNGLIMGDTWRPRV